MIFLEVKERYGLGPGPERGKKRGIPDGGTRTMLVWVRSRGDRLGGQGRAAATCASFGSGVVANREQTGKSLARTFPMANPPTYADTNRADSEHSQRHVDGLGHGCDCAIELDVAEGQTMLAWAPNCIA